jgi:hypothetical protein
MAAFGEKRAAPHVEHHAMRRQITGVVHQRSAKQQYADLQPVGGWDKLGYAPRGAGRVEQPGDIGVAERPSALPA